MRLAAAVLALTAVPALAGSPLFMLDPTQLPFDLGPGAPLNQPSARGNLPTAPGNSGALPANGARLPGHRPGDPANRPGGANALDLNGVPAGYVTRNGGTLNLFDPTGRRVAYRPAGGTRAVFSADGAWCGTVADLAGGGQAVGLTKKCMDALFEVGNLSGH